MLRADNVGRCGPASSLQGANIPVTPEAEARLLERGVLSLPDFIVNAGGVICAAVEYHGGTKAHALRIIDERIRANTSTVLQRAAAGGIPPASASRS